MEITFAYAFAQMLYIVYRLLAVVLFIVLSPILFTCWTIKHTIEMRQLRNLANMK